MVILRLHLARVVCTWLCVKRARRLQPQDIRVHALRLHRFGVPHVQSAFQIARCRQGGHGVARATGGTPKQHGSHYPVSVGTVRATGLQLRQMVQRPHGDGAAAVAGE